MVRFFLLCSAFFLFFPSALVTEAATLDQCIAECNAKAKQCKEKCPTCQQCTMLETMCPQTCGMQGAAGTSTSGTSTSSSKRTEQQVGLRPAVLTFEQTWQSTASGQSTEPGSTLKDWENISARVQGTVNLEIPDIDYSAIENDGVFMNFVTKLGSTEKMNIGNTRYHFPPGRITEVNGTVSYATEAEYTVSNGGGAGGFFYCRHAYQAKGDRKLKTSDFAMLSFGFVNGEASFQFQMEATAPLAGSAKGNCDESWGATVPGEGSAKIDFSHLPGAAVLPGATVQRTAKGWEGTMTITKQHDGGTETETLKFRLDV